MLAWYKKKIISENIFSNRKLCDFYDFKPYHIPDCRLLTVSGFPKRTPLYILTRLGHKFQDCILKLVWYSKQYNISIKPDASRHKTIIFFQILSIIYRLSLLKYGFTSKYLND